MTDTDPDTTDEQAFDYRGVTRCFPHNNRMPCPECGKRLLKKLKEGRNSGGSGGGEG